MSNDILKLGDQEFQLVPVALSDGSEGAPESPQPEALQKKPAMIFYAKDIEKLIVVPKGGKYPMPSTPSAETQPTAMAETPAAPAPSEIEQEKEALALGVAEKMIRTDPALSLNTCLSELRKMTLSGLMTKNTELMITALSEQAPAEQPAADPAPAAEEPAAAEPASPPPAETPATEPAAPPAPEQPVTSTSTGAQPTVKSPEEIVAEFHPDDQVKVATAMAMGEDPYKIPFIRKAPSGGDAR